jgi:hypothetical protein
MRKIRLSIEELSVESFNTAGSEDKRQGTVRGNGWSEWEGCQNSPDTMCATYCEGCPQDTMTCFASCRMTNGYQACIDPYC